MKTLTISKLPALDFDVQEAVNQLRINLSFAGPDVKTVLVTSSVPNEGKSYVSINLWRALASIGKRVLLIDCDLRLSQMRSDFGMTTTDSFLGIAHLLSGQADIPDCVYKTNVPNGYILPVTNLVNDPTVLLENERFAQMIETLKETFDFILIDCPPLGSVADALTVSKYCDGSILVVRSGDTPKRMVNNSVQALKRASSPLLGIVLNRIDMRKGSSSYYKDYAQYGANYYNGGNVKK